MKRRIHTIVIIFFLCSMLSSCVEKGNNMNMELVDQNTILYEKCEKEYSYKKIEKFTSNSISLTEFGRRFGVRQYKYNSGCYYVVVKTDEGFIILWFDAEMRYSWSSNIYFSDDIYYDSINSINVGDDLEDVMAADKTGKFDFLRTSWTLYPKISWHYFKNGECFCFTYDEAYKVESIWTFSF